MKNIITEELGYMKYLFGYQRGVVISEQSNKTGCIKGNCVNGIGTYKWPNGDVYVGQWKDGVMNGQGTYKFPSGDVYVGQYKDGVINGIGTYKWPNGTEYTGQWKGGKMNGKGTIKWSSGTEYTGQFKDDLTNGQGTYTYPNGAQHTGTYKNNMMDGEGTYTNKNGVKSSGTWVDGKLNGKSPEDLDKITQSNQTNTGCIKGDCENGQGTYKWPNGEVYVGQWKDGNFNGQGTFKWSSGTEYEGQWKDGKKNGQGTAKYSDGGVYVGQWKDDVKNGIATYTNINGVKSSGTWVNDKLDGKSLKDLDKITQSNQTKPKGEIKEHWEDVVKYYKDNKDPNWSFVKREDYETENYIWDRIEVKSTDTNDSDSLMRVVCNGDVWFWNKGRGTGSSKAAWEWNRTKPVIKFFDSTKNASGYVQPTDKDWSAVYDDNKVIGLNAKGPLVKDVQQSLILIGYSGNTGNPITKDIQGCLDNPENCDGVYGKSTKEMVKQFQKDNGLSVDGVVGKQTYYAFNDL